MPLSLLPDIVLPPPASIVGDAKADVFSTASRVSTRGSRTLAPHQGALDAQAVEMLYEATPAQGRAPLCSHDRALRGRAYNGRAELAASPFAPFSPVDETVFLEEEFYLTQSRVVLVRASACRAGSRPVSLTTSCTRRCLTCATRCRDL